MRTFFSLFLMIILGAGVVHAQYGSPGPPVPMEHPALPMPPGPFQTHMHLPMMGPELHGKMHMFRMWRLIDVLDMSEEQAAKFFPLANRYFDEERQFSERWGRAADSLRQALDKKDVSEKDLKERMQALRKVGDDRAALKREHFDKAAMILSPRQQAQLLLFEDHFQGEIREVMQELRERRMGKVKERREILKERKEKRKERKEGKKGEEEQD
jgi:hypothetical protein